MNFASGAVKLTRGRLGSPVMFTMATGDWRVAGCEQLQPAHDQQPIGTRTIRWRQIP
jgi:hypothetical protein